MNVAFKHLEHKLRFADLTVGQWTGILVGVLVAGAFVQYGPVGGWGALIIGMYVAMLPACAAWCANLSEFDVRALVAAAIRWRRYDARFVPGPGSSARGYVRLAGTRDRSRDGDIELELEALWD